VVVVNAQFPAATLPTHVSTPSVTVTFPVAVPPGDVTVNVTVTTCPTTEGSGVSPVIAVVVLPAVTVTVAVCVTATVPIVVETVFVPTVADERVPMATPFAFVVPTGWVSVLPIPVAASVTLAPLIGLPCASRAVTVIVEEPIPAVIDVGDAATVDSEAETAPAVTVTVAVWVTTMLLFTVAVTVLAPAAVELRVPVICPLASVVPVGCARVFPVVGAAASVTVAPLTGLPFTSRTVTVIVALPVPAVIELGAALTPERAALGAPAVPVAVNVTGLPAILEPAAVAVTVLGPAAGPRVHEVAAAMPSTPVVRGVVGLTVPSPEATANVTPTPATGFPAPSRRITDGGGLTALPTGAACVTGLLAAIAAAAPAVSVIPAVAGVRVPLPKLTV